MNNIIDHIRDKYDCSYRFIINLVETDMKSRDWTKEECLNIIADLLRAQMKLNNEYTDSFNSDININS